MAVAGITGLAVVALGTSAVIGATIAINGGPVTNVRTKTATDGVAVSNTAPTDVAGMSLSVAVPANQQAMFVITFSAATQCFGGQGYSRCYIQVLLDGSPARPGIVTFDSTDLTPDNGYWQAHSMQFVAGPAGPGTHTVKVQFWSDSAGVTVFKINSSTLTVLRAQV